MTKKYSELKSFNYIPYGHSPDLDALVDSSVYSDRYSAAVQAYGLEKLVNDKEWGIRAQVATKGYALDTLKQDEDEYVRAAVVRSLGRERRQSKKDEIAKILETFLADESRIVRYALAEQGYYIDILMTDKDPYIRIGSAVKASDEQLAFLSKDNDPNVRLAVVHREYNINRFIFDDNEYVREAAQSIKIDIDNRQKQNDALLRNTSAPLS